jgi:hypothetical protein
MGRLERLWETGTIKAETTARWKGAVGPIKDVEGDRELRMALFDRRRFGFMALFDYV